MKIWSKLIRNYKIIYLFAVKEVIYGVAQNFSDEILYTLDQLQSAEVSIESESQDITDKNGNIIRTIY